MTLVKTSLLAAVSIGFSLSLAACDKEKIDKLVGNNGPTAKTLSEVRVVRIKANNCSGGISSGLSERGFSTTTSEDKKVDAILDVNVTNQGRNLNEIPHFGGVGNKASYTATLHGADDKVLFSTSGHQGSMTMNELCGDIGDDIGTRLKGKRG